LITAILCVFFAFCFNNMDSIKNVFKHTFSRPSTQTSSKLPSDAGSFYDLKTEVKDGAKDLNLKQYEGKVSLVVNVASKCGYTKGGYEAMNKLYKDYKDKGLAVLAFPCNQFFGQEPGSDDEISENVCKIHKTEFPLLPKGDINGKDTQPVYKYLKTAFPGDITWNFAAKFIIDRKGNPVARIEGDDWSKVEEALKVELEKQ